MTNRLDSSASIFSSALILAALAAICTALVSGTHELTRERIEENRQRVLEESLAPVLNGIDYDGKLSDSTLLISAPHDLPGNDDVTVFRVFADNEPIAAVFDVAARDGYSGPIRLLIALTAAGVVNRVRVLEHRETPGLGDRIESSRTDWVEQFNRRSLGDPGLDRWEVRRDGGEFDQLSGATVTSRAVVKAVRQTLLYFASHREAVFASGQPPATDGSGNDSGTDE